MNRDRIQGNWKQLKGRARRLWGRLTGDHVDVAAGTRERVSGEMQEAHGVTSEATEKQLAEWRERQHKSDPIHK